MRFFIIVSLLLIQMILGVMLASAIVLNFVVLVYVGIAISIIAFLSILKNDQAAIYKMTWVIVVLAMLPFGGFFYLLFGNQRATRRIKTHMQEHALIAKLLDSDGNLLSSDQSQTQPQTRHGRIYSLFRYIRQASSYHAYNNTQTKYYAFGEAMFADMLAALDKAEKFIFLEFFIIAKSSMWDQILEILVQKAEAGVDVRLIADDLGSQKLFTNAYIAELRSRKLKVLRFNPMTPFLFSFMNHRGHRKILVTDGHTAFCGGLNIADEYINVKERFGVWKDTGLRLRGDAVWSYTLMFIETWDTFCRKDERINDYAAYKYDFNGHDSSLSDGFVLPYGDTPLDKERLGENIYIDILNQAEHYVYIFTPYLIISEIMIQALKMAAQRGVDVRIVTPGIPDKKLVYRLTRSYYQYLLVAGVRIYEYTPGFLHAKSFVSDDKVAIVGTINLDYRSLYLHFECATLLYNADTIRHIKEDAQKTITQSREVLPIKRKWRVFGELTDAVLHLFAPIV